MDLTYWPSQARIGRYLVSKERVQNVRSGAGYKSLASHTIDSIDLIRRDDLLNIPYSRAILECTK